MSSIRQIITVTASRLIHDIAGRHWSYCSVGDLGTWATGSGFPLDYQGQTGLPYLLCKVGDMNRPGNEVWIETTENTIDDHIADSIRATIHPIGTVIFPKIGGAIATNKRRILARPSAIDNNVLGITPHKSTSSEWLYHFLRGVDFSNYQKGTSVPALSQKTLGAIRAPRLPVEVQRSIATFLTWLEHKPADSTWEAGPILPGPLEEQRRIVQKIESLATKIEEAQHLRKGSSEELQTLTLSIAKHLLKPKLGWIEKRISDCSTMSTGTTPPTSRPDYYGGELRWYTPGDLGFRPELNRSARTLSDVAIAEGKARIFEVGTVLLVAIGGSLGKVGLVQERCSSNQQITGIRFSEEVAPKYGFWWMRSLYHKLRFAAPQATLPIINQQRIGEFAISIPPMEEQLKIVRKIERTEEVSQGLITIQRQIQKELDALMPSILSKAFAGEL